MDNKMVMGIDFGTDSVRTIVVNALTGEIYGQAVQTYPRWEKGLYCIPGKNQFRQHPFDYIEGLERSVQKALANAGADSGRHIRGISIDTTGSTPCAIDREGTPLALKPDFQEDPDAMFILWKDHTAVQESEEINNHAKTWGGTDYTRFSGGNYSPEWFWAKILHTLRKNKRIRESAYSWIEQSDWIPFMLTDGKDADKIFRSRCTAGHKAMWNEEWEGLPSERFLTTLDSLLAGLRNRLYNETYTVDTPIGKISKHWSDRLGINPDAVIGAGALDAHIGAVGGGITPGTMIKVMGTSTCDMIITEKKTNENTPIAGISGQVNGSIIPGYTGFEAGQSAFGDIYAWFRDLLSWAAKDLPDFNPDLILPKLEKEAEKLPADSRIIALDWFNGRRTPDGNPFVTGAIAGLRLGDSAPAVYRALVEATAFGSKAILDRFTENNIRINRITAVGGIAKKSSFVMQILSDILNREIRVLDSEQTVAAGAAMCASVVCGIHPDIPSAQKTMKPVVQKEYIPDPVHTEFYKKQYKKYLHLGQMVETR